MELIRNDSGKRRKLTHDSLVIIGRRVNSGQGIKKVSRSQISLLTDLLKQSVTITNLGVNPIKVNLSSLSKLESAKINGNAEIEIPGDIKYKVKSMSVPCHLDGLKMLTSLKEEIERIQYELEPRVPSWHEVDDGNLIIFTSSDITHQSGKIAAFDMDGTLIKTKSGKVFPVDENDWTFLTDNVISKLKALLDSGYKIVIFTNQGGLSFGSTNKKSLKNKIKNIVLKLGIPAQVYIATNYDIYRKPCPGMWFSFLLMNSAYVDTEKSFFVGDAAGRPQGWSKGKKKDFSMADRLFARNIQLKFLTPDEFFLGHSAAPFNEPVFDPFKIPLSQHKTYSLPSSPEVVIMVGSPGSGKSHFVESHLIKNGYISISRDVLGSWQNCVKAMEKFLALAKSIVIDNTNPTSSVREKFVNVAKSYSTPVRCFVMETTKEHCTHNNKFRQLTDKKHIVITDVIINEFWKKYEKPIMAEGYAEILFIPFVPTFTDPRDSAMYKMYLTS